MRASIEPFSAVPGRLIRDHLVRCGLRVDIVDWKYFDSAFRPAAERAYVWVRGDQVNGMIGLIPFALGGPAGTCPSAWTCDWFVESPERNPGIGVLLLKKAIAASGVLVTVGGNDLTARIVPRLAAHVEEQAAVELSLSLRLGGTRVVRGLERRLPALRVMGLGNVAMPMKRTPSAARGVEVTSQAGVSREVAAFVAERANPGWTPVYDAPYLDWQLARCPVIQARTIHAAEGPTVRAAAAYWRPKDDRRPWRLALWTRRGPDDSPVDALLNQAVREMKADGGHSVSVIVGRQDDSRQTLADAGFRPTGRSYPLYVLTQDQTAPMTSLSRLGYLDSDLGHRF